MRPGFVRRASIYFLSPNGAKALAESRDEDPLPYVQRADHALTRHYHLVHDLQASQFFVDLATASRELADQGLYHWVGEQGCVAATPKRRSVARSPTAGVDS